MHLEDLWGTWKLLSAVRNDNTPSASDAYGFRPLGRLIYTPDGRVSALITSAIPVVAYFADVELVGARVVHHVSVGVDPIAPGTDLVREVALDAGGLLHLTTAEEGNDAAVALIWERLLPVITAEQPQGQV
jgi:hypothetical protein